MAVTKNALLRYKVLDDCFRNPYRKWTLDALIEKVSDALYEYEGIRSGVSRRTIQADIQVMRSDKLGYNAPLIVTENKYYSYSDPDYSITRIPVTGSDLARMNEAVDILKQFRGFSHFDQLNEVIQKLEDHVYTETHKSRPLIVLESNEHLRGIERLDMLYRAIVQQKVLSLRYQSFKARDSTVFYFHPWWLREFKNRWFLVGVRGKKKELLTLALDRILEAEIAEGEEYRLNPGIDPEQYYLNVLGVTVSEGARLHMVSLFVNADQAPYVETKPLHASQRVVQRSGEGIIITLRVQLNYELEREILGFSDGIKVLAPRSLRKIIERKARKMVQLYEERDKEEKK